MDANNDPPPTASSTGFLQPVCSFGAESNTQEDLLSDFKRLVVRLGGALDDEEPKGKIRYLHKDKLGPGGESMKALDMLERLEGKGIFSARNIDPLESLLKDSDRCDLIETHLEPYRQKYIRQLNRTGDINLLVWVCK